jgi:hypothetical protein
VTRPRFDQRAIVGEVLVGHPRGGALDDPRQELARDVLIQQTIGILGERSAGTRSSAET